MQEVVYHSNYDIEDKYFWFLARNAIIGRIVRLYSQTQRDEFILDVGCGTGGFAKIISATNQVICLDTEPLAIEYCKKRGLNNVFLGTLDDYVPNGKKITTVTMLDVIEHIDDDLHAVKRVYDLLETKGRFIATVPAYQWLWSHHDEMHMHYRRFTLRRFCNLIEQAGFKIKFSSYFNTLLFPLAALKRISEKMIGGSNRNEPVDPISPILNTIFTKIFSLEKRLIPPLSLPFGLSIVVVGEKE